MVTGTESCHQIWLLKQTMVIKTVTTTKPGHQKRLQEEFFWRPILMTSFCFGIIFDDQRDFKAIFRSSKHFSEGGLSTLNRITSYILLL